MAHFLQMKYSDYLTLKHLQLYQRTGPISKPLSLLQRVRSYGLRQQFQEPLNKAPDDIPRLPPREDKARVPAVDVRFEKYDRVSDAKPPQALIKGPGQALDAVSLNLVFWGQEWQTSSPPLSSDAVEIAVRNICSGAYLEAAYLYKNRGLASVDTVTHTNTPASITVFTDSDIQNFLQQLLNNGTLPAPSSMPGWTRLYAIFMPTSSSYTDPSVSGKHFFWDWTNPATQSTERVYYLWTLNDTRIDFVTVVFSHELVESYTDPDANSVRLGTADPTKDVEIADVCNSSAYLDGVLVQSYWSADQNSCVIPYYFADEPHVNIPTPLSLQVVAIRQAYSRERRSLWIQKIRAKDSSLGDIYDVFTSDAIDLIENGANGFFVLGADGSRAEVVVAEVANHYFLKTEADGSTADNLLSLPAF